MSTRLKALKEHHDEKSCRICFGNDADEDEADARNKDQNKKKPRKIENPLIAPCNCIGSSRYIHLKCLQ